MLKVPVFMVDGDRGERTAIVRLVMNAESLAAAAPLSTAMCAHP